MKPLTYVEKKRLYFEDKEKYEEALISLYKDKELYNEKRHRNITHLYQKMAFNIVKTVVIINHSEFCSFVLQGMISSFSNDYLTKNKSQTENKIDHIFSNKKKERDKNKKVLREHIRANELMLNALIIAVEKKKITNEKKTELLNLLKKEHLYTIDSNSNIEETALGLAIRFNNYKLANHILSKAPKLVNWKKMPPYFSEENVEKKKITMEKTYLQEIKNLSRPRRYDYCDPSLLYKFSKLLIKYGAPVHKSFFEIKESDKDFEFRDNYTISEIKKCIEYKKRYKESKNQLEKFTNWFFFSWLVRDLFFESSKINSYCDLTVVCDENNVKHL